MASTTTASADNLSASIHEETVVLVRNFFEIADACKEQKRRNNALNQEYDERVQAGTENDPDFQARFDQDFSHEISTPVMLLLEKYNDPSKQDRLLILCESRESASKAFEISEARFFSTEDAIAGNEEGEVIDNPLLAGDDDGEEETTETRPPWMCPVVVTVLKKPWPISMDVLLLEPTLRLHLPKEGFLVVCSLKSGRVGSTFA